MRWSALLLVLLVAVFTSGCFVNDLLDDANEQVSEQVDKQGSGLRGSARKGKGRPGAKPAAEALQTASGEEEKGPGWWETAKTVSSQERPDEIVECSLSGRTQFMKRDDCLSRGGRPL
jgi:hypothetical protein